MRENTENIESVYLICVYSESLQFDSVSRAIRVNLHERYDRSISVLLFPYIIFFCLKNLEKKIRLKKSDFYQCKEGSQSANSLPP